MNRIEPQRFRRALGGFLHGSLAWKRALNPRLGRLFFTVRNAFPVSASALQ